MTKRDELRQALMDCMLFQPAEVDSIMNTVGAFTMGNAVVACEILGIELTGSDIDIMFQEIEAYND